MTKAFNKKKMRAGSVEVPSANQPNTEDTSFLPALFARNMIFHIFLIAAIGLITYSNTFNAPFMFDDTGRDNEISNFISAFKDQNIFSSAAYHYNPRRYIGYLTFALNNQIGGRNVAGYHIVNLAIHITNAILVYILILLTFKTPAMQPPSPSPLLTRDSSIRSLIALFPALLFVSHPIQTMAVTYIYQRFASLATMFYILSVVLYIKGRLIVGQRNQENGGNRQGSFPLAPPVVWFSLSLASCVLAMMTKETAFTLPVMIVLYEFVFFGTDQRKSLFILIPVLLTLLIIPLTLIGTNKPFGEIVSAISEQTRVDTTIPRWDYLMTQMRVITTYIRLIFFPAGQNVDYDYPVYHSLMTPSVFLSFVFLLALIATAALLLRKSRNENKEVAPSSAVPISVLYRMISFGIFWFFIALAVESSIIPIADVIFEHRVYLPSIGFFLALICGLVVVFEKFFNNSKIAFVVLAVSVIALSGTAYARNTVWKDSIVMWEDIVKKSPAKSRAKNNLGSMYLEQGRYEDALRMCQEAIRISPDYFDAYSNIAAINLKLKRFEDAISASHEALKFRTDPHVYNGLGLAYLGLNRMRESAEAFTAALKVNPKDAEAYNNLSTVYRKLGKYDEAIRSANHALEQDPRYAVPYNNLGLTYVELKKYDEARVSFENALALDSTYAEAYNNLGGLYLLLGKYAQAEEACKAALKANPAYVRSIYNLGVVYALQGRREEALKQCEALSAVSPGDAERLFGFLNKKNQ